MSDLACFRWHKDTLLDYRRMVYTHTIPPGSHSSVLHICTGPQKNIEIVPLCSPDLITNDLFLSPCKKLKGKDFLSTTVAVKTLGAILKAPLAQCGFEYAFQ